MKPLDPSQVPMAVRMLRIPQAAEVVGYSQKAIRRKIERGDWLEGYEYHRAPDGRVIIDLEGYATWVRSERRTGRARGS